jgi:predicted nucleic acid-binding Zn ribbon protein
MPTYEYECEAGHTLEIVQSIHDEPLKICNEVIPFSGPDFERCEAPMKKLISKTSFVLKGDGWFKDGY